MKIKVISLIATMATLGTLLMGCSGVKPANNNIDEGKVDKIETSVDAALPVKESLPPKVITADDIESTSKKATSFNTIDLNGNPVSESLFSGSNLTVVVYWATYCPYCIDEISAVDQWSKELKKDGINLVGAVSKQYKTEDGRKIMADDDTVKEALDIITEKSATYTNIVSNEELQNYYNIEIRTFPTVFFVDSRGNVIDHSVFKGADLESPKKYLDEYLSTGKITEDTENIDTEEYYYTIGEEITLEDGTVIVCVLNANDELIGVNKDDINWYYSNLGDDSEAVLNHIKEIEIPLPRR
jgi:thiol-disulfide isomerase/thioredoxin